LTASRYQFLQHTTDAYIQSKGATFEEALENAGLALFDTMCNLESISHKRVDDVEADGADEVALLYDWLETLLLKFELDGKAYSKFHVELMNAGSGALHINAKAYGETYNRQAHGSKVEVKAVTYHRMEVVRDGNSVILRFILDL
jgi:SHS2 domain-containing protein